MNHGPDLSSGSRIISNAMLATYRYYYVSCMFRNQTNPRPYKTALGVRRMKYAVIRPVIVEAHMMITAVLNAQRSKDRYEHNIASQWHESRVQE